MNKFLILFLVFIFFLRQIMVLSANNDTYINTTNITYDEDKNIVELAAYVAKEISKSEIRRLIKSNGIKINNQLVNDEKFIINDTLFLEKRFIKLSIGKKKHFKIIL